MFQSTEQALAVAYWMFEHQPGPKSSTAMVIDGLRERFDRSFIEHLPSGLSPHEWQAQAVMPSASAGTHRSWSWWWCGPSSPAGGFRPGLAALRDWLKPGADPIEQRATLALLMRMFRRPPSSIREIERLSGLSKSTLHRWDKEWRERVVALLRQALQRLEEPMAEVGIVGER